MSQNRSNLGDTPSLQLYKKSPSTQYIREGLRRQFQERLKLTRRTQQSRNRNFYSNIVADVQKQLVATVGLEEELNPDEMFKLLLEVEQEVHKETLEKEAENYESLMEQEINVLLQDTNYVCQICNQPKQCMSDSNNVFICSDCANLHFNTEKL
ncbi:hypothetical protein ILUMI_05926 [Ignelater luminosus]|uniref:RPA-interacting protein n=1 Tax=Ignelater luminosus TaxID=2038154 RepID=A0A8K0DBP6_IGNLU|nr:hypothetical protein ILUMI_05926 [Ignelater luminosus]